MSTSGSYDWSITANDIINEALEDLNVILPGGTPAAALTTSALAVLNRITKALSTRGIRIWSVDWTQKTFSAPSEVTGTDANVYTCILSHTSSTDNRPITGGNYTTYWVEDGETGGVWGSGADYSSTGDFDVDDQTIEILQAFIREGSEDTPLEIGNMQDYFSLGDKTVDGKPSHLYYDKLKTGHVYLYPQPDFTDYADYVLHYLRESMLEDFDAVGNDSDFQSIYLDYLVKELRYALAPKYGHRQEMPLYKRDANDALNLLKKKEANSPSGGIRPSYSIGG